MDFDHNKPDKGKKGMKKSKGKGKSKGKSSFY